MILNTAHMPFNIKMKMLECKPISSRDPTLWPLSF